MVPKKMSEESVKEEKVIIYIKGKMRVENWPMMM